MRDEHGILPYCGSPPIPDGIWSHWNFDPVLLFALAAIGICYAYLALRMRRSEEALTTGEQALFFAGLAVTAAALVSPLCSLSVALFAARVGQHMILALIAAPMLVLGRAVPVFASVVTGHGNRRVQRARTPLAAACGFAALLWFWHSPAAYAATFRSDVVYWAMHVTMVGAAIWLWHALLQPEYCRLLGVLTAGLISSVQMGLLGALITFAPHPLYAPHLLTTAAWGLTPLTDQQLGGAIMWVPGCAVFLLVAIGSLASLMSERRVATTGSARSA